MEKTELDELFLATLGMYSIDANNSPIVGAKHIHAQFEQVLEANNMCKTMKEKGPKYVSGKNPQYYK